MPRGLLLILASLVTILAVASAGGTLMFGAAIDKYLGQKVAAVNFVSEDFIDTTALTKAVSVAVGKPLEASEVSQSIRTLFQTREFSYIEVDAETQSEAVVITFKLRPDFFFADFRVGGDLVLRSPISSLTPLPLGEAYSPKTVEQLQQKVRETLEDSGYYRAEVSPNVQFLSKQRLVTVEYLVRAGSRATISSLEITGSPLLTKEEVLRAMKLHSGGYYDSESLRKDFERLRKLYSQRGFLNAAIRLEKVAYAKASNSVAIEIFIDSSSFVYIELTGGKISKKRLRELVPIYEEGSIDIDLIEEGRRNIEDYFQRKGHFDVKAKQELIEVASENAYQINYTIDRGKRQKVVSIDFTGVQHFNRNQLMAVLATRVGGITSKGKFSRDLLEQDAESLRNLYLRQGFEQVKVQPSFQRDESGINIAARFDIQEGPRTYVRVLETQGNESLTREEVLRGLSLAPGGPFSQALLQEDERTVEGYFLNRGFVEAKVHTAVERLEGNQVKVVFSITEGDLIRVDDVHVVGNYQTQRKVITRQIDFHEGDPLSQERLLTSQQKLYSLGLFNRVDIVPVNVKQSDSYRPVIIRTEEGSPIILGYGGGYQDREGPRGTIEISHNNLFGLARSLSFRTRASFLEQRGQITYKEPRLFNRELDSFVTLFAENKQGVSFNTSGVDAALQVLKRFGQTDSLFFRYNYETVDLSDVRVNPQATGQEDLGTLHLSAFSTAWLRDTRDDPIEPTRGFFNSLNFSVASKLYGSESNLASFFGQHQNHRRVWRDAILATSFRLGLIWPYGSTPEVPISERFFAGGSTTLRGFGLDLAGPLDPVTNKPLGGNALVIVNAELRIPVTGNIDLAPFYDTGNVFGQIKDVRLSGFSNTLGFGVRYKTPFGPLRVDIGFNLAPPEGQPWRQLFFTIGNPF